VILQVLNLPPTGTVLGIQLTCDGSQIDERLATTRRLRQRLPNRAA
jgi:hypothetical protein